MSSRLQAIDASPQSILSSPARHAQHAEGRGPMSPTALSDERPVQVPPLRITLFDQPNLPGPIPTLDLFLAGNRQVNVSKLLEPHQTMNAVSLRKPSYDV